MKKLLTDMNACTEAVEWVGDRDLQKAWKECERGDWMLWFAGRLGINLRTLTLAKARCAKLVIHLMEDERSRKAVEVAEKFGLGQATCEELDEARDNAAAAYVDATDTATYVYADTATAVYADVTDAVALSAAYAVADATADAVAASAAYAYAKRKVLKQCAEICREVIPFEMIESAVNKP